MGVHIYPGFAMITLQWRVTLGSHVQQATWGINPAEDATPSQMAADLDEAWGLAFPVSILSNKYTWLETKAAWVPTGEVDPIIAFAGDQIVGTFLGAAASPNVSGLIKKRTGAGGRTGQGRSYLTPGYIEEGNIDESGTLNPTTRTSLQAKCDSFFTHVADAGHALVLFHESQAILPRVILSLEMDSRVATQRRRLR
jgi:hypothetical protein